MSGDGPAPRAALWPVRSELSAAQTAHGLEPPPAPQLGAEAVRIIRPAGEMAYRLSPIGAPSSSRSWVCPGDASTEHPFVLRLRIPLPRADAAD